MSSNLQKFIWTGIVVFLVVFLIVPYIERILPDKKKYEKDQESLVIVQNEFEDAIYQKVEKIAECESSKNPLTINYQDRDKTASFGYLQFKPETFREYAVKYGLIGEKADWNWIMTMIFNKDFQQRLGYLILKNEPEKAKYLWGNCYRKIK